MAPTYHSVASQEKPEATSDTFSFTVNASTASDRLLMVQYAAPAWVGGINTCSFEGTAGFKIWSTAANNAGSNPIRCEVWAIINPSASTAGNFQASCGKTYHGDYARITVTSFYGASVDSTNFYSGDSADVDVDTLHSITLPADTSSLMFACIGKASKTAFTITNLTERYDYPITGYYGQAAGGTEIGSSAATTVLFNNNVHEAALLWGANLLPPQDIAIDLSGSPAQVSGTIQVGTVDDGNISITTDRIQGSLSITGTAIEKEPITADMHMSIRGN